MRIAFTRWRSGGLLNRPSPRKRLLPKKKTSSGFEFVSGLADGASAMPAKWSRPVFSFRFYEGKISRALPIGAFAAGTQARKKAPCPQKMDHDEPQKAGENVALNANCLGRRVCTQNSAARQMLRRSSSAVATSREGRRSPRSGQAVQHRRWGGGSRGISSLRSQKSKQLDRCIGEWPRQRGRADDQWLGRSILSTFDASARRCRSDHLEAPVPLLILQQLATRIPENY